MGENEQRQITELLVNTSAAHNEFEQRELGGVYDLAWSGWYAAYLVEHGLGNLLGEAITADQLAGLLAQYDIDYRAQQWPEGWPDYYTAKLMEWRTATRNQPAS